MCKCARVCVCVCVRVLVRHSGRIMEAQYMRGLQVTQGIQDTETLSTSGFLFLWFSVSVSSSVALCLSLSCSGCVSKSHSSSSTGVSFVVFFSLLYLSDLHLSPPASSSYLVAFFLPFFLRQLPLDTHTVPPTMHRNRLLIYTKRIIL